MSCSSASRTEQEEFRAILRRFFERTLAHQGGAPADGDRAGLDRDGWKKLNQELGLTAVHIPEAYGGQGFGCVELGIVLEEMGRGAAVRAVLRRPSCWRPTPS